MSLRPYFRGFWDDPWAQQMGVPSRLYDQFFGNPLSEEFFVHPMRVMRQMQNVPLQPPQQTGLSEVINNDTEFRVNMDVQHFRPDEINIKTKDNRIVINAKHEERPDEHGFIMREFTRQYILPKDVDPATVKSSLSRDGVLTLKAPKLALEEPKERIIPITQENGDN